MRKLLIIILILIGLLLLVVPGAVGMQAEKEYQKLVNQLESSGLQVVRHDYRRGWFNASAETELELPIPQVPDPAMQQQMPKPVRFTLRSEVGHGPFSAQGMGDPLVIDTEILSQGKPLFPPDYPATIQTRVKLDGMAHTLIDLPSFEVPAKDGHPAITFKGAKGEIVFRIDSGHLSIDASLPQLHLDNGRQTSVQVEGASMTGEYERGIHGLMLGDMQMRLERLDVSSSGGEGAVQLRKLGFEVESTAEGDLAQGSVRYTLDAITVNSDEYGPAEVTVRVDNLSAPVLGRIQEAMDEVVSQGLPPQQQGMAVMSVMMGNGAEFLKSNPRVAIEKLHVQTPEGVVQGHFQLQPVDLEWAEIANMAAILNKLKMDAELRMPETLFLALFAQQARQGLIMQAQQRQMLDESAPPPDQEQISQEAASKAQNQLDMLLQQELLVGKGEDIGFVAKLQDGLLSVNGKGLPLPMLAPPPPQVP